MTPADYVIHLTLSVVLIVGGYQFYFWCQRNPPAVPRQLRSPVDDLILGAAALSFPVLIGLSCLFTKQHYVVDVPAGAALGWVAFHAIGAGL